MLFETFIQIFYFTKWSGASLVLVVINYLLENTSPRSINYKCSYKFMWISHFHKTVYNLSPCLDMYRWIVIINYINDRQLITCHVYLNCLWHIARHSLPSLNHIRTRCRIAALPMNDKEKDVLRGGLTRRWKN
jgi:hypothetical protein